ncbi:MAG: hypothetical protein JXR83_15780 [Deltaproteobacteria bacterium]|nr:hypothetical protein [Deltaproteobacteria bacterium]
MARSQQRLLIGPLWILAALACDPPAVEPAADSGAGGRFDAAPIDGAPPGDAIAGDTGGGSDRSGGIDGASGGDGSTALDAGHPDVNPPDTGNPQGVELNPGWIGGACSGAGACNLSGYTSAAICETTGFANGMCTQACTQPVSAWVCPDHQPIAANETMSFCIDADGSPRCVARCDFDKSPTGCRPGYSCVLRQRHGDPTRIESVCLPSANQGWPGEAPPAFDIGAACDGDTDCASLVCLSWPGGYCTKTMCEYAGCPSGSSCFFYGGRTVCLRDCTGTAGCRSAEGYACDDAIDACWPQPTGECQPVGPSAPSNPFNRFVLEAVNDAALWPRDGTYPFCLGSGGCGPYGFIHDGAYLGQTVFEGGGDCMCTGHTLEIFLDAWRRYREANSLPASTQLGDLTMEQLDRGSFYQQWQGTASAPQANLASAGLALALVNAGIRVGNDASSLETVQPGDFVNLSRDPPSGHAVVFVGWIRDNRSAIIGLRYYGCNPSGWDPEGCGSEDDPANAVVSGAPSFMSEYFYDVVGEYGVIRSGIYGLQIGRVVPVVP